jgi:hypothetical protein
MGHTAFVEPGDGLDEVRGFPPLNQGAIQGWGTLHLWNRGRTRWGTGSL